MPIALKEIVENVWHGSAGMEEWSVAVAGGSINQIAENVIAVSTGYLFGNVTAIRTDQGLVLVDSGSRETASQTIAAIREWDSSPVHTVIYTHGHIDHTFGARLLDQQAQALGQPRPRIIAHRNVLNRFKRYDSTHDLNSIVMGRQFNNPDYVFPANHRRPDDVYDDTCSLEIGGVQLELFHGRGETDDASFVWLPEQRILVSGDFVIWVFPNAGNPRKVQRYAPDWAVTLRQMQALKPTLIVPGHGPVIASAARCEHVLNDGAEVLESLAQQTLQLMNNGYTLDMVLHQVKAPENLLAKPYLLPKYDDPEFVVRGIWHLYAGWYDDNPAHLKPARDSELADEIASLAGGADRLAQRAAVLAADGQTRLAAHLIEFAAKSAPENSAFQSIRADVYAKCIAAETSLIGKAIYGVAFRDAQTRSAPLK